MVEYRTNTNGDGRMFGLCSLLKGQVAA